MELYPTRPPCQKFAAVNAAGIGNIFAMIPANKTTGLLPEGPNFSKTNLPDIAAHFPTNCSHLDQFEFVQLPTIFPIPYGTTAIKGSIHNDSVGNALCNISDGTGPIWIKLISNWTQPFADAILEYPAAKTFLPTLKKGQHWADSAHIQSRGLTEDEDEDYTATNLIATACSHLQSINTAAPAASSIVVTSIPDNQSILTSDSGPRTMTPTKPLPPRPTAASQADTRRACF